MTIQTTVIFRDATELAAFAKFWDSLRRSETDQPIPYTVSGIDTEDKATPDTKSKPKVSKKSEPKKAVESKKPVEPKEEPKEEPKYDLEPDPATPLICDTEEFVSAVRKWHAEDPQARTKLIQRELEIRGETKLTAVHPKYYPEFLIELGISL